MGAKLDTAKKKLKQFSREIGTESEFKGMFAELTESSDRACAVLCGNILDDALRDAIALKFQELNNDDYDRIFDGNGPLATFSSKCQIAYAMNVIGKEDRKNLDIIRDIRNAFAHSLKPLTFNTPSVRDYCTFLTGAETQDPATHPRFAFVEVAASLIIRVRKQTVEAARAKMLSHALLKQEVST